MPKKYIEREAYSKALKDLISDSDGRTNYEKGYIQGLATANGILLDEQQTPTADVAEVVRCKIVSTLCFRICMVNVHKHIWELSDPMIFAVTVKERTENND